MQTLGTAAVSYKGSLGQDLTFVHMAEGPGVQPGGLEVFQGAGRVAVRLGLSFECAVEYPQLKAALFCIPAEETGQIAVFAQTGVAYAVDHRQWAAVLLHRAAFHLRPEHGDVVRPGKRCELRVEGVMVAVRQKHAHAHGFQTAAAVAQGQLGFDAVVLFIIDVAGQDEEVGFFRFTEAKQSLQGGEGGLAQKAGQMFALGRFAGKAEKGRVQMQVRRVDITYNVHGKPRVVPDRRLPRRGAR